MYFYVIIATESVRQLTQSASLDTGSNQGFFFKPHEDSAESSQKTETIQKTETTQKTSVQTGLLKVRTYLAFSHIA